MMEDAGGSDEEDERAALPSGPKTLSVIQTLAMCLCILTESAQVTMPYTVAVYMVRDFLGGNGDQHTISKLTGILAAVFMVAQLLTSYPWGLVSDRYGRKGLVILGNFFTTVGIILFGLSPTYLLACGARFLGGFFNCSYMNIRSMIGESTDATTQALVMGYVSLAWGLGTVTGPIIGGGLTNPCDKSWFTYQCQEGQVFQVQPFLLPCLALAAISFTAMLSSIFFLKETLPRLCHRPSHHKQAQHLALPRTLPKPVPSIKTTNGALQSPFLALAEEEEEGQVRRDGSKSSAGSHRSLVMSGLPPPSPVSSYRPSLPRHIPPTPPDQMPWLEMGSPSALVGMVSPSVERTLAARSYTAAPFGSLPRRSSFIDAGLWTRRSAGLHTSLSSSSMHHGLPPSSPGPPDLPRSREGSSHGGSRYAPTSHSAPFLGGDRGDRLSTPPSLSAPLLDDAAAASPSACPPWWKDSQVVRTILGYGTVCFLYNLLDELVPIFAAAPIDSGGLNLSAAELSGPLSTSGIFLMAWALLGYPLMQHYLGPTGMIKLGLLLTAPMAIAIPASSLFAQWSRTAAKVALTVALSLKNVGQNNSFSSSSIMVNLMAPPASVGAVNGASQTLASFVRAVGPALGGYLWAFSLEWGWGHQYAPFALASAVAISGVALYYGLRLPERELCYDLRHPDEELEP